MTIQICKLSRCWLSVGWRHRRHTSPPNPNGIPSLLEAGCITALIHRLGPFTASVCCSYRPCRLKTARLWSYLTLGSAVGSLCATGSGYAVTRARSSPAALNPLASGAVSRTPGPSGTTGDRPFSFLRRLSSSCPSARGFGPSTLTWHSREATPIWRIVFAAGLGLRVGVSPRCATGADFATPRRYLLRRLAR